RRLPLKNIRSSALATSTKGCERPVADTSTFTFWTIGCLAGQGASCAASSVNSTRTHRYCSAQPQPTNMTSKKPCEQARKITLSTRSLPTNLGERLRSLFLPQVKRLLKLGG